LLAHGRWFSLGTPASSTTVTGRHDIAEILLKVALKHQKIKSKADYINNHILNVFKYIFNIELIIKFQSDFLNESLFVIYKAGRKPTPYWG
jgi:hypothetical protein